MDQELKTFALGLLAALVGWCGKSVADYLKERKQAGRKWQELVPCSKCKNDVPRWYYYEPGCTTRHPRYHGPRSACGFCTGVRSLPWLQGELESDYDIRAAEHARNRIVASYEEQLDAIMQTAETSFKQTLAEVRRVSARLVDEIGDGKAEERNLRELGTTYRAVFQSLELHKQVSEEVARRQREPRPRDMRPGTDSPP